MTCSPMLETCMPCLKGEHRRCKTGFQCACNICRKIPMRREDRSPEHRTPRPKKYERPPQPPKPPIITVQEVLEAHPESNQRPFNRDFEGPERRVAEIMIMNGASDLEVMQAFKICHEAVQKLRSS